MHGLNRIAAVAIVISGLLVGFAPRPAVSDVAYFVATDCDDANPGTAQRPFATLEAARDAIRARKAGGPLNEPATVWLRGGTYRRARTFELKQEDSGTSNAPVVYRACEGERVHLVGGLEIQPSWCRPVEDEAILGRLEGSVRGKVLEVDLKEHGITDYGDMSIAGPMFELFCDGRRLPLARFPNEGWLSIGQVLETGADSTPRWVDGNKQARTFQYSGDRPGRWIRAKDMVLHGFWWYGWMDQHVGVERIDTEKRAITLVDTPGGGIRKDQWFCALNLLEEIDRPGEWYLDRDPGMLYFLPPDEFPEASLFGSTLNEPLIVLDNAAHVTVRGVTLEVTRGVAVVIRGGSHNRLAGCILRGIGSHAAILDHGAYNGLLSCDIHDAGSMGVRVTGGDRSTLQPAGNYIRNCHIHHYAQRKKVYQPAVRLYGVGHRVAHNLIHDAPHQAIGFDGNDHIIGFNEIHDVVLESSDAGVLYCGRDWTFRGTVIRHNFFHHIPHRPGFGSKVVYMDDCAGGVQIFGNVFYDTRESVFIGGGRDNSVTNNLFVECEKPFHLDTRGLTWDHFRPGGPMYEPLERFDVTTAPWSTRYPKLARLLDEHPQAPRGNVFKRNISCRCTWRDPDGKYVDVADNYVSDEDPGFVDPETMNFQLRDDSTVYHEVSGFEKIPFDQIGLYTDEFRTTLPPPAREVRTVQRE